MDRFDTLKQRTLLAFLSVKYLDLLAKNPNQSESQRLKRLRTWALKYTPYSDAETANLLNVLFLK